MIRNEYVFWFLSMMLMSRSRIVVRRPRPEWPTRILLYSKVLYIVSETLRQRSQEEKKTTYVVCGQIECFDGPRLASLVFIVQERVHRTSLNENLNNAIRSTATISILVLDFQKTKVGYKEVFHFSFGLHSIFLGFSGRK